MALYTICIVHLESPINEFINVARYLITETQMTKQKGKDKLTESHVQSRYFIILMCVNPVVFCTIVGVRYVNTYSRTQLYLIFNYIGVYNNDMFRPYMWAILLYIWCGTTNTHKRGSDVINNNGVHVWNYTAQHWMTVYIPQYSN